MSIPAPRSRALPRLRWPWLLAVAGAIFLLVVLQDRLHADRQDYPFYLSESGLFGAFWLLMVPFYALLRGLCRRGSRRGHSTIAVAGAGILVVSAVHFLVFPALVYGWSALVLGHAYTYGRSLSYLLAENLFGCLLGYTLLTVFALWGGVPPEPRAASPAPAAPPALTVKAGGQTTLIPVEELRCLRAEKPYVALHTAHRKHLVSESLSGLADRLSAHGIIRVHKSALVRLSAVVAYASRRNGDYDLTLDNGQTQRLSRHYREAFFAAVDAQDTGGKERYTGQAGGPAAP